MSPASPSGIVLVADLALAVTLALYFALGHPRTWFRDRLGWVVFSYALAVVGLLALIVLGLVFDAPIPRPLIFVVSLGLGGALVAQIVAVYRERREGRAAGLRRTLTERSLMAAENPPIDTGKVAKATVIWFQLQRVLRTLVQVIIPAFLGFAVVLPAIIESMGLPVDSQLRVWLLAVAGGVTAVATALAKIMAIPAVNAWLIKIGLGSVPRSALYQSPSNGAVHVKTDPKAISRG